MRVCDISVYQANGTVNVLLSTAAFFRDESEQFSQYPTFEQMMLLTAPYENPASVMQSLNEECLASKIEILEGGPQIQTLSMNYCLPRDPELALDYLTAFNSYIKSNVFYAVKIDQNNMHKVSSITELKALSSGAEHFPKDGLVNSNIITHRLAEAILEVKGAVGYAATFDVLRKVCQWYTRYPDSFSAVVYQYSVLLGIDPGQCSEPVDFIEKKFLFALHSRLIRTDAKNLLNRFLDYINVAAKKKLYARCIGQLGLGDTPYTWDSHGWHFLFHAEFRIRPDGRVSILLDNFLQLLPKARSFSLRGLDWAVFLNKDANLGAIKPQLQKLSGNEKKLLNIGKQILTPAFKSVLYDMGKCMGLQFADDSNFQKEIIFTPSCSQELIKLGLHLTPEYFKRLVKFKNTCRLFRQYHQAAAQRSGEPNRLSILPHEVMKIIFSYTCLEEMQRLGPQDARVVEELVWSRERDDAQWMVKSL